MAEQQRLDISMDSFAAPVDDDLVCTICCGVVQNACETPCGHLFCSYCIHRWVSAADSCPVDRKRVDVRDIIANKFIRNKVLNLEVECHCGENVSVRKLGEHQQNCEIKIECTVCNREINESSLKKHMVKKAAEHVKILSDRMKDDRRTFQQVTRHLEVENAELVEEMITLKEQMEHVLLRVASLEASSHDATANSKDQPKSDQKDEANSYGNDSSKCNQEDSVEKEEAKKEPLCTRKLFIGNVKHSTTKKEFHDFFNQFGVLEDSRLAFNRNKRKKGKCAGHGTVTYMLARDADYVLNYPTLALNGKTVDPQLWQKEELLPWGKYRK